MTQNGMNYLALVREEFVKRNIPHGESVSFCKVKKAVTKENASELKDNLIPDANSPDYAEKGTHWIPIDTTSYPRVCSAMTANQAGYFAIRKCQEQGWDFLEDWECVLSNLEMDM